jgi:hypothetical protein
MSAARDRASRPTLVPALDVEQLASDFERWQDPRKPSGTHRRVAANDSSVYSRAEDVYWARIGAPTGTPRLLVPALTLPEELRARSAGFIASHIDGVATVADVLDYCELPHLTALCLLCELLDAGIVAIDE